MPVFQKIFAVDTQAHEELIDITERVKRILAEAGVRDGQCTVYTAHATAAVAINENDDPNIGKDLVRALDRMIPAHDGWLHDRVDNNAASHIKSAIVGPSETIPVIDGKLALGTWQNVFLCEFDGPRQGRKVIVSVLS
jgi:secondary thiamine-phosphate synthase enzyme